MTQGGFCSNEIKLNNDEQTLFEVKEIRKNKKGYDIVSGIVNGTTEAIIPFDKISKLKGKLQNIVGKEIAVIVFDKGASPVKCEPVDKKTV